MLVSYLHSLWEKVKNFSHIISKRQKIGLGFLILPVLAGTLFWVAPADAFLNDVANGLIQGFSHFLLWLARLCIGLTVFSLKMFIEFANYNGYIDAPTVVVGWVMLRDIANMFFVVALLVIAFGTILGIEQYEWKKGLGKLLFAAVFINFSKMICGLIIDIAHVFTITFLNAVSAAAGGNLINMFKLDQMMNMISGKSIDNFQDFPIELLGASFLAFVFAVIAMMIVGAYATMMMVRVVALWVLIVLSPLAFILQVIPNTEGYAREWWEKFTKEVIIAPVMVFFLWLAFATLGSGNIVQTLGMNVDSTEANAVMTQGAFNGKSLSISSISSWENMANFFIAIAFLVVGFTVSLRLGAVGAGMVGGALNLAKKAALYGAGYYVAKAVVGGALGKTKEIGGEYGKLAGGRLGLSKIPFFGSQSGSKLRRQAALDKMDKYYSTRADRIKKEGGGLGAKILGDKWSGNIAKETEEYKAIAKAKEANQNKLESEYQTKKVDQEMDQFRKNKIGEMNARFGLNISLDASEDELDKAEKGLRSSGKLDLTETRAIDAAAMKGLTFFEGEYKSQLAEDAKELAEGTLGHVGGPLNMKYMALERGELEKRGEERLEQLLKERAGKVKQTDVDSERKKLPAGYQTISDDEIRNVLAEKGLSEQDKALALQGITTGLRKFEGKYAQKTAETKIKKYASETERLSTRITDFVRGEEGKLMDEEVSWERSKISANLKTYEDLKFDELFAEIARNFKEVQKLRKIPRAQWTGDQEVDYKNARQRQMSAVASAISQGYGGSLAGFLGDLDKSYEGIQDLGSADKTHQLVMGLVSARDAKELQGEDNFSEVQEEVRKSLKEKDGILFRTLMTGMQQGSDKGFTQFYAQMTAGVDAIGSKKIGFTNAFTNGVGKKVKNGKVVRLGTGKLEENGVATVKKRLSEELLPNFNLLSSKDGRAYVKLNGAGKVTGVQHEAAKAAIINAASLSQKQIYDMDASKWNFIFGGSYDNSGWDGKEFRVGAMKDTIDAMNQKFYNTWKVNEGTATGASVLKAWKEVYIQLGVEQMANADIDKMDADQLQGALNSAIQR